MALPGPPASPALARQLVDQIVQKNGFVRESTLETMSPEARREVEDALLAKDKKIGSSVLTLAKNLYTSNARFVFELLQNTEDNEYSAVLAAGQDPFVAFSLYHDRLVVDCNEDGFTRDNLAAICDVGNSSKSGSQAYIGEKGIGFKSVFMAAWKVHIQSGHLSFSFLHRKGDSGMGMVTPRWEEPASALPQLRHTRMTLFLHEEGHVGEHDASRNREDIWQQLRELEPTLLLFVSKLKRIEVVSYDREGRQDWAMRLSRCQDGEGRGRVVLEKRNADTANLDSVAPEGYIYHVVEHMATNVARHDNRALLASEGGSKSASGQSRIVLAFPVSSESVPVIEPQKVFAFLPMKQMGFNFLIQADFVTQANREDVVTTSHRNKDLIQGVLDAMMKAITQLCEDKGLQYTWMRYLPRAGTHHWDPFWQTLVDGIKERLLEQPVVRTRGRRVLRYIRKVKVVPKTCCDQHGNPLFRDLNPEIYISDSYNGEDIDILKHFGLSTLSIEDIVMTVRQDLAQSAASRLQSPTTDDDWHTRVAKLLLLPWERGWDDKQAELRGLALIPLQDGSWANAADGDLLYGTIGAIRIPAGLGFRLVPTALASNRTRRVLFDELGVRQADCNMVRARILSQQGRAYRSDSSREFLKFLYLTHETRSDDEPLVSLCIIDRAHGPRLPAQQDVYLRDNHSYGAESLLGAASMPLFDAFFIHPIYLKNPPSPPSTASPTWTEWLHDYVGVRRHVRLLSRDGAALSRECKHIAENQGGKLLGFLKHVWPVEGPIVANNATIREELRGLLVPCTKGTSEKLSRCYMPLEELQRVRERFAEDEIVNFIDLRGPNESKDNTDANLLSEWAFLTNVLGVTFQNDVCFGTDLLDAFLGWALPTLTSQGASKLLDLYQYIESLCMGAAKPNATRDVVRTAFRLESLVLVPSHETGIADCRRGKPEECLWEAPDGFTTMRPLKARYRAAGMDVEGDSIRLFFQGTLHIPDISHNHIIGELKAMAGGQSDGMRQARILYRLLQEMYQADTSIAERLRTSFEQSSLVYVEREGPPPSSAWRRPSACLWSSATTIDGKAAINTLYPELEQLFTTVLWVPRMTLAMVHEELLGAAASGNASTERIKQLLFTFNSLLAGGSKPPPPGLLLKCRLFPVRLPGGGGEVKLVSAETEFFIVDRDDLCAAFGGRVRCLDFWLTEVCRMRPFLAWAGLEARYLSRCLEEVSRVNGGVEWPVKDPRRDVKRKAYGLLRIAAKYNSPRYTADPHALYSLLRTAVTVETEGISSTLMVRQDGEVYEHEVSKGDLHLEERDGSLKIYLPRDEAAWEDCFLHALPIRLLSWMMTPARDTEAAVGVVMSILTCSESSVLSLLRRKGVPEIDTIEEPLPVSRAASPRADLTEDGSSSLAQLSLDAPYPSAATLRPSLEPGLLSLRSNASSHHVTTRLISLSDHTFERALPLSALDEEPDREVYLQLLASVIAMAETVARRDYGSTAEVTALLENLSLEADEVCMSASALRNYLATTQGRHNKVGAAGELFVFELLSNLALPCFCADNWQSTIRHYAAGHPKYRDILRAFTGRETSDIVYDDTSGALTALLIARSHLQAPQWAGVTPRYYIEVKSTTDGCDVPFFVSQGQAERMRCTTNGPSGSENQQAVYAIFRVFNLGTAATGLRIYVDPEEQRRTGNLRFSTEGKYTVVPGEGMPADHMQL